MKCSLAFTRALAAFAMVLLVARSAVGQATEERAAEPIDVREEHPPAQVYEDQPVEVQVIRSEAISEMPARNAADVVQRLAGIRTQQRVQGEQAAVSIEGMPPEYTLILVNGQRYTGQIGAVTDLADIPIENVERIEVLRGSQALRYGSEAGGGVINIITKKAPTEGYDLTLDGGAGDDGQLRGAGHGGVRIGDAGITLALDHDQIKGYNPCTDCGAVFPAGGSKDSRLATDDVYSTLQYDATRDLSLRSSFGWRREDERIVPLTGDAGDRDFTRWLGGSGLTFRVDEFSTAVLDVNYFRGSLQTAVGRDFSQTEDEPRVAASIDRSFGTGPFQHLATVGFEARRPTLELQEGAVPPNLVGFVEPAGNVDKSFQILALYTEDELTLSEWASLLFGVRGEMQSQFSGVVLPQASLLLHPVDMLRFRFSAGLNSRAPSLPDLYQPAVPQLGGTYFLAGNPDLQRETSQSYRAGFELSPWRYVSLSSTYFYNDIDNFITSIADGTVVTGVTPSTRLIPPTSSFCDPSSPFYLGPAFCAPTVEQTVTPITSPLYRKANLQTVITQGVETQLVLRPLERVSVTAAFTYMSTFVRSPNLIGIDQLPNSPPYVVDLETSIRIPYTETILTPRARFRSSALTETSGTGLSSFVSGVKSNPSWVVDLRLLQPFLGRYEAYLDLRNITNTKVVDSYQIRGTNFLIGIRAVLGEKPPRRAIP